MHTPQRSLDYSTEKEGLKTPINQRFQRIANSPAPSPLRRFLSDTINGVREKGTKELDRIYETFSEFTGISPIPKERPQKSLRNKITKRTPKSTLDIKQTLNEHKAHTMLTPIMERHSLNSFRKDIGTQTPLVTQRSYRSPSRNLEKESSFYNNSFTISPTQRPSCSTIKAQQDPANNPEKSINHSTSTTFFNSRSIEQTPSKSNSASRLVEMLMAENVRLERLQKNLDYILLQTSELAKSPKTPLPVCDPGPIHQKTYPREQYCYSPISPLVKPTNHSSQHDQYDQSPGSPLDVLDNTPSSFHNHFHASPPANLLMSPPPPPPPPPPAPTMAPKSKTLIQTSKNDGDICKDKNVLEKHLEPNSPHRLPGLLEEIPKAKLKSARIIRSPSGRRVSNQFWKEIHKDKLNKRVLQEENLFPSYKRPRTGSDLLENCQSLAQDSRISKPKDNEDAFWKSDGGSSAFNEKLFRVAREEREENHRRAKSPLQSTLGDELKKADNAELQANKEGKNDARSSFSSQRVQGSNRPPRNQVMLTELQQKFKEKQNLRQIKGDEWKFSGTSYHIINEEKK